MPTVEEIYRYLQTLAPLDLQMEFDNSGMLIGDPEKAVDLLCTSARKFAFDVHGLADMWPFPYFPANGGLLTAVAMMCAGWDGLPKGVPGSTGESPGFPKDGSWVVRYEGFNRMM